MKTVKLTKAQLRRIIREGLDILSERSGTQLAESNVAANLKKKPEDLSDAELKEIYEELVAARKEHHAGRMGDTLLDSIEKTHGPFQEEMKKREEEKKKQKPKQKVPFSDYYMDQMSNYY